MLQFPQRTKGFYYAEKRRPIPQRSKIIQYPVKARSIKRGEKHTKWHRNVKNVFLGIFNYIKIYIKHSSLHGMIFIIKPNVSWVERAFWLFLLICCYVSCILIGSQSIDRFRYKSTVMGIERDYHYWNTSVPSLTVCPMDRLDRKTFGRYCDANNINNQSSRDELFDFLESLANATYFNFENIRVGPGLDETLDSLKIFPENYMELIYNLTTNYIFESSKGVSINAVDGRVSIQIRQVLTEYGICYMTNSELGLEYSVDYALFGRYPPPSSMEAKSVLKGTFFDADVTIDFLGFPGHGVDSYIHSTDEVSRVGNNVGLSTDAVQYKAVVMEIISEENFENDVSIAQRNCRFHHESNLIHFDLYTKNLCLQECRLNLAMEYCNCIPHFYPNRISKPKPVCSYKKLRSCFPALKSNFLKLLRNVNGTKVPLNCDCLQNCQDTIVTLQEILILTATKSLFSESLGVRMTVETWPTKRLKRQVVYSFTDLLVSFGGTAGLFLGFSVLSGVELFYFFTIRLIFHLCGTRID